MAVSAPQGGAHHVERVNGGSKIIGERLDALHAEEPIEVQKDDLVYVVDVEPTYDHVAIARVKNFRPCFRNRSSVELSGVDQKAEGTPPVHVIASRAIYKVDTRAHVAALKRLSQILPETHAADNVRKFGGVFYKAYVPIRIVWSCHRPMAARKTAAMGLSVAHRESMGRQRRLLHARPVHAEHEIKFRPFAVGHVAFPNVASHGGRLGYSATLVSSRLETCWSLSSQW